MHSNDSDDLLTSLYNQVQICPILLFITKYLQRVKTFPLASAELEVAGLVFFKLQRILEEDKEHGDTLFTLSALQRSAKRVGVIPRAVMKKSLFIY